MISRDLAADAFSRVHEAVHAVLEGLTPAALTYRVDDEANTIAWLLWHLTRVQDDHIADVDGRGQVWLTQGWVQRFALPLEASDTGYGHGAIAVGAVKPEVVMLGDYFDAVHRKTLAFVEELTDEDFDRIVDERWDPPVSLGVRLNSIVADDLQHAGQAAYIRGLYDRK